MPDPNRSIGHVSDTALMVAACRAVETARPDGLVKDPFAERLAGDRGLAIARARARFEVMCFGVGIRSRFLDELVLETVVTRGVSTVLSLGAGLDTRPWRLDLPQHLRWIEADFPAILDYKAAAMKPEKPRCRVEQAPADLSDPVERRALMARAGDVPALMITEGLLQYLPADTVEAIATEPVRTSGIRYWLLDLTSPRFAARLEIDADGEIRDVRAEKALNGTQILEVLGRSGWTLVRRLTYTQDAWQAASERIKAMASGRPMPQPATPPPADDPSGVQLFEAGAR